MKEVKVKVYKRNWWGLALLILSSYLFFHYFKIGMCAPIKYFIPVTIQFIIAAISFAVGIALLIKKPYWMIVTTEKEDKQVITYEKVN